MSNHLKNCGNCAHSARRFLPERGETALMCSGFDDRQDFVVQEQMGWNCRDWYPREPTVCRTAIIGAMESEVSEIRRAMTNVYEVVSANRVYTFGEFAGKSILLVVTREGKVAAAQAVTTAIVKHGAETVIFVGVAGGIDVQLRQGDVVVGIGHVQYDVDVSAFGRAKYELPSIGKVLIEADAELVSLAETSAARFVSDTGDKLYTGVIATGDKFVSDSKIKAELQNGIANLLCVDMESASAAQVCFEHGVKFVALRVISDNADESASLDFESFVEKRASIELYEIVRGMLEQEDTK